LRNGEIILDLRILFASVVWMNPAVLVELKPLIPEFSEIVDRFNGCSAPRLGYPIEYFTNNYGPVAAQYFDSSLEDIQLAAFGVDFHQIKTA
jgi:hypothetical protein